MSNKTKKILQHGFRSTPHQARGATLIIGLIVLLLVTLLSVATMEHTSRQERMTGNLARRTKAMEAAESTLRDAERDIQFSGRVVAANGFVAGCIEGLCTPSLTTIPNWKNDAVWSSNTKSVAYGAKTGAGSLPSTEVSSAPRYIIEPFLDLRGGSLGVANYNQPAGSSFRYRVTARAVGPGAGGEVVLLQSLYKKQ